MLIADGGGGYGGTDWNSRTVREMWLAIADQDTDKHFDVVAGWRQTADLTITHLGQVQMYRDNLASVWPPSKSPAAAAYLERLDKLIADLQATHDAASANYTAFSTVALTLSLARNKLKPLFDQFEANENANKAWKAEQDAQPVDPTKTPKFTTPPVSSVQQEQLNNQARVIMYDLSSTVISGQSALQKPKPYDPAQLGNDESGARHDGSSSDSGFATPPIIPPPGGADTHASSSSSRPGPTHGVAQATSTITPGSSSHAAPGSPGTGGVGTGPILGGIATSPVAPPPTSVVPPGASLTPALPPTSVGTIPGVIAPNTTSGQRTPVGPTPGGGRLPEGAMRVGSGIPTGRTVLPSGGVIGATPGSGTIGQMPATTQGRRALGGGRVNPVGGVIGQEGAGPNGVRPAGRPVGSTPASNIMAQPSSRATRKDSDDRSERTHWDPDNPWATHQGVDPVVLPPGEPGPIEPGPAIGMDR
ncbi:hypothetical protein COUCH_04615 [Couchioplanes caeruleus]|uniref:hypothetical protein n=1 Tax=Couchioplanes caeruleus TaxID=56438 RepID=UPI0020BDB9E3|nr:hypothetical protein [Couchioplanes caeruleus]UQU65613.1 hypothetical protein COUCH_04615 [Couchioplanes caeruleus]